MYDNNKLGELRPNQLITTFGPGAIVDAVKDSVTILDLNYWKDKGKKIVDGRLAAYLGVDCFYMPRTSFGGDVPVVSFPYMHVCSNIKCGRIFDVRKPHPRVRSARVLKPDSTDHTDKPDHSAFGYHYLLQHAGRFLCKARHPFHYGHRSCRICI